MLFICMNRTNQNLDTFITPMVVLKEQGYYVGNASLIRPILFVILVHGSALLSQILLNSYR